MRMIYIIFSVFFTFSLFSQNTFSEIYDLDSDALRNYLNDFSIFEDKIYTYSTTFCDLQNTGDATCVGLTKFDNKGNILESKLIDTLNSFGYCFEGLAETGNNLIFSSYLKGEKFKKVSLYNIGDQLSSGLLKKYAISNSDSDLLNTGVENIDDYIYIYGSVHNQAALPDSIQIIKIDYAGDEIWRKYYTNDNASLKVNGLQATPDGNLAFILELSGPQGPDDYFDGYHIMKIDTSGAVLDSFVVEETDKQPNRLLVASDGSYYFGTSHNPLNPDDLFFGHYGAINKVNSNMDSIEWVFRMPSEPLTNGRTYDLYDFLEASNGDIIICGTVFDNTDTELATGVPGRNSTWNGFIIRLSSDGVMKWLRLYKHNNDLLPHDEYGKFRPSKLDKIKELPDGRLVGAGNVYVNNRQFSGINETETEGFHLWLLMVDEHGCLEGEECEEIIRIDGQVRPTEGYLSIIESGQTWINRSTGFGPSSSYQYHYSQDKVYLDGQYYYERIQSNNEDGSEEYIQGYYSERNGKLIQNVEGSELDENVILDMSLLEGDTFLIKEPFMRSLSVAKVDTITYMDDVPRKRIELGCNDQDGSYYWIEGIGELYTGDYCLIDGGNGFVGCVIDSLGNQVYMSDWVDKCWIITSTIELETSNIELYPNPARDILTLDGLHTDTEFKIFDILGQEVQHGITKQGKVNISQIPIGTYFLQLNEGRVDKLLRFQKY